MGLRLFQQEDERSSYGGADDPWAPGYEPNAGCAPTPRQQLVEGLVQDAASLPRYHPKRYYRARQQPPRTQPPGRWNLAMVQSGFAGLVSELTATGYFGRAFGSSCCDDGDDPDAEGQRRLSALLCENQEDDPVVQLWPPLPHGQEGRAEPWSEGLFYDVVEALHDLVARPRRRFWHEHCGELDYADYTRAPGQAVYRWRVNELLDRSTLPLRLADTGTDVGLLVTSAGGGRGV